MSGDIRIVNVGVWGVYDMNNPSMWCLNNSGWSGNNGLKIKISQDAYETKLGNQKLEFYLLVGDTTVAQSIIEPYNSGLDAILWESNRGKLCLKTRN